MFPRKGPTERLQSFARILISNAAKAIGCRPIEGRYCILIAGRVVGLIGPRAAKN